MRLDSDILRNRRLSKDFGLKLALERYSLNLAQVCFGLTVIFFPFRYRFELLNREIFPVYQDYTNFLIFPSDIALASTLLFWAAALIIGRRRPSSRPEFFTALLAALTILSSVTTLSSVDPALSAYHSLRLTLLFGFYLYIINEIRNLDQILWPVGLQIVIQGSIGIAQVLSQHSLGLLPLGEYPLDPTTPGASVILVHGERLLRAYGLSDHPNILGGSLAFGTLVFAGGLLLKIRGGWKDHPNWYLPAAGVHSLGLLALFLTFSRSGWLAWVAGGAFVIAMLWKSGRPMELKIWVGLSALGLLIVTPYLLQNLDTVRARVALQNSGSPLRSEEQSLSERSALTRAGNQIFSESPLRGVGLGGFPLALRIAEPDFPYNYQPPHIVLLEVAAETGILTALIFSLLLIWPWLALLTRRRSLPISMELVISWAVLLSITLVSFLDYYPWLLQPGRLWLWFSWGLWAAMYKRAIPGQSDA